MMTTRTAKINGELTPAPDGAIAWKYNDPTEDARWVTDQDEYEEIARIDPSLLVDVVDTKTEAERISDMFDDGQSFETPDGEDLTAICGKAALTSTIEGHDRQRFVFSDGSAITVAGNAWDLGYGDCWCWQGIGHDGNCLRMDDGGAVDKQGMEAADD